MIYNFSRGVIQMNINFFLGRLSMAFLCTEKKSRNKKSAIEMVIIHFSPDASRNMQI